MTHLKILERNRPIAAGPFDLWPILFLPMLSYPTRSFPLRIFKIQRQPLIQGAFGTRDRTGRDGTIFSCPAFGALLAWDGTGLGGTKNPKICPTKLGRPDLSHAWDKCRNDIFALKTSKNHKNTNYKKNSKAFFSLILVSLSSFCQRVSSLSLSLFLPSFSPTNTHLSLSTVAATAAGKELTPTNDASTP